MIIFRRLVLGLLVCLSALPMGVSAFILKGESGGDGRVLYRIPDLFMPLPDEEIPATGKAVLADLDAMTVTLYVDHVATMTIPILSKGRRGTPWETPAGRYAILLKEPNHFSSLGHVFMPWSMQFYGNFFIHGWPYDIHGIDVPKGYSGGCIRLSTPDAETVYRFVEKGTPLLVRSVSHTEREDGGYYLSETRGAPTLSADAFMVMDVLRAQVLWKKQADATVEGGAATKILATLAALESMDQYSPRAVPSTPEEMYHRPWMTGIDTLPAKDLVAPLLFTHGTDIEGFLAGQHGRGHFIQLMQAKAKAFGMHATEISDVGVASTTNVTTIEDTTRLLRALRLSKPYILEVTSTSTAILPHEVLPAPVVFVNEQYITVPHAVYRGGVVDRVHGTAMVVMDISLDEGKHREVAISLRGSEDPLRDLVLMVTYVADTMRFISYATDRIIESHPASLYERLQTIIARTPIIDALFERTTPVYTSVIADIAPLS